MKKREVDGALPGATGELSAVLIHGDGSHRDCGVLSGDDYRLIGRPIAWWRWLWKALRTLAVIPAAMSFAAFVQEYAVVDQPAKAMELFKDPRVVQVIMGGSRFGDQMWRPGFGEAHGLVVTGAANFLAADFASGQTSPRISSMNFHDSGTGATAATSTDSALGTQAGPATRATGVQSQPSSVNVYKTVGTIAYVSVLAITEWGLFNQAAQGGTLWDRRVFGAINVISGDSIAFSYSLTINAGGT